MPNRPPPPRHSANAGRTVASPPLPLITPDGTRTTRISRGTRMTRRRRRRHDRLVTDLPTFADVLAARRRIAPYLHPTPLHHYAALDAAVGTTTFVKHENHQPIGAFKVRGGVNLVA